MNQNRVVTCILLMIWAFPLFSQNQKKALKNSLIPDKFIVISDVDLKDTLNPENMLDVPGADLNSIVLSRIFNAEVAPFNFPAQDYQFSDTISVSRAKELLGAGIVDVNIINVETGEPELKKVRMDIRLEEIVKYRFIEEWSLDEKDCKFSKHVIAYCPIRKFYRDDDYEMLSPIYKVPFAISNDKKGQLISAKNDKWTLVKKAIYEVPFDKKPSLINKELLYSINALKEEAYSYIENENMPYLSSIARQKFANLMYQRAMDKNTICYDFGGFYRKNEDVKQAYGVWEEELNVYDPESDNYVQKKLMHEFIPEEIKAILFFEDWYINESTLQIDKRITAFAPVRYYYRGDDVEGEQQLRKSIPAVFFTDMEDKDRLEKLYYKLVLDGYSSQMINHIELFSKLGQHSKSPDFKAFCTDKQNQLFQAVIDNNLFPKERLQLLLLSENVKTCPAIEKLTNAPISDLQEMFNELLTYTDTCSCKEALARYLQCEKRIGEKIIQLDDNCQNRLNLLKVYVKLNLKEEIKKWENTDKKWLLECLAGYYLNSESAEDKKTAISLYRQLFNDTVNCDVAKMYFELPFDLRPKNIDIDNYIQNENETGLLCLAKFLDKRYFAGIDSFQREEVKDCTEKIYNLLFSHYPKSDYLLQIYSFQIMLKKPINLEKINQLGKAGDVLTLLYYLFDKIYNNDIPSTYLQSCSPFVEKIAKSDLSEEDLWTFVCAMAGQKKWGDAGNSKTFSAFMEIVLKKLLTMNPDYPSYLFMNYELEIEKGMNPDIGPMLNQENQENLEIFAKFFGTGHHEYIITGDNTENYLEIYLLNAAKFYEKLAFLQPNNMEIRHENAGIDDKLCWYYLINKQNSRALECATRINQLEKDNDYGIISSIWCYLLNKKAAKAYKWTDKYLAKKRASDDSYKEFFKYETENLLNNMKDNEELKKYLDYLDKWHE